MPRPSNGERIISSKKGWGRGTIGNHMQKNEVILLPHIIYKNYKNESDLNV